MVSGAKIYKILLMIYLGTAIALGITILYQRTNGPIYTINDFTHITLKQYPR